MSAGFKVGDDVLWGTNGAVETYVESLAAQATAQFGPDDPLAAFFRHERESFFMGSSCEKGASASTAANGWWPSQPGSGRRSRGTTAPNLDDLQDEQQQSPHHSRGVHVGASSQSGGSGRVRPSQRGGGSPTPSS
jgi:hypothetical protein